MNLRIIAKPEDVNKIIEALELHGFIIKERSKDYPDRTNKENVRVYVTVAQAERPQQF